MHRAPVRWTPPETDPAGNPWDKSTLLWRSTTPELSVVGKLVYAVSRDALDIDGLSEAILTALVESEIDHDMSPDDVLITRPLVRDVADLFELDFGDLTNLATTDGSGKQRRVGEKTLTKIRAEVRRAHESAPFARVLTAIGMRSTGRTICRRLAAHYGTIDAIWDAIDGKTDLQDVEGIGPEKAALIRSEFQTKRDLIGRLDHLGLNMGRDAEPDVDLDMPDADQPDVQAHLAENDRADKVVAAPPLAGLTVVVTGSMKGTALAAYGRNEMNELIETHGGKSSGSVSTKTSLLVSSEPESTKTVKARDLGVKIVDPEEFRRHDRTDRIVASNPPSANAPSCDSRRSPIVAVGPLRGRRARRSPNPTSPGRHSMTPFLAWLLFPPLLALAFCGPPGVLAALRLHRSRRMAKHFLSAQSLLAPPLNRASQARTTAVAKAPAEAAVPSAPAQPSEIASSELMVLAARYLRALDGGDLDTKVAVLQSVSAHELVTRLCLVGRQLTREHADATGRSTSALLDDLYERAVRRHHELVVLE